MKLRKELWFGFSLMAAIVIPVVVLMPWERDTLAVPLSQLEIIRSDEQTRQAVEDWHYWTARGYQL